MDDLADPLTSCEQSSDEGAVIRGIHDVTKRGLANVLTTQHHTTRCSPPFNVVNPHCSAPTGSGKTLAAFLFGLDQLMFAKESVGVGCRIVHLTYQSARRRCGEKLAGTADSLATVPLDWMHHTSPSQPRFAVGTHRRPNAIGWSNRHPIF